MKILFVSFLNEQVQSGGTVGSRRNYNSLVALYGKENVILFSIKRNQQGKERNRLIWFLKNIFVDIFTLGFGGLDKKQIHKILVKIKELKVDLVFVDSSLLGIIAKKVKKQHPCVKVVSFFHNIEYLFFRQAVMQSKHIILFYRVLLAYRSEFLICKYSDKIISLHHRDELMIKLIYKRCPDFIIPVSLEDTYFEPRSVNKGSIDKKVGLFVGSYFFQNIHGVKWFIKNVLPYVNMKLWIVGSGMDLLKNDLSSSLRSIEVFSNVPDLTYYYENADFMVMPIFLGAGMKIKTVEALMYGKYIFGTNEAFMGFEVSDAVGEYCNTSEEFIKAINKRDGGVKFNIASKQLFVDKYSFDSTLNSFRNVFSFKL